MCYQRATVSRLCTVRIGPSPSVRLLIDGSLLRGFIIGLVLAAPVGPVGVLCVQRALSEGRLHGLLSGLGAAVGDALYGAVAAYGVVAVSQWLQSHFTEVRVVGGVVLLLLAAKSALARPKPPPEKISDRIHTESLTQDFFSALLLTVTNPVTLLAFAGIMATLGDPVKDSATALVAGVFLGSATWWLALSFSVDLFRNYVDHGFQIWVNRVSAVVLLAFGVGAIASVTL